MHTSPSAIKLADTCDRAHAYRYVLGLRTRQPTWDEVKNIPRPQGAEAVKEWNRIRRPALGTEAHRILELWYKSHNEQGNAFAEALWQSEPGAIAFSGLRVIPHPSLLKRFACEHGFSKDFIHWASDGAHDYHLKAFVDFHALDERGRVIVIDYKTTSDFRWMKTAAELANDDQQGVLYPLHAMREYGKETAECMWLYLRTEQPYAARAVSFEQHLQRAKEKALPIIRRGAELIERQRLQIAPEDLPANSLACNQYGGCEYHQSRGGPCNPARPTPGQLARVTTARFREREKKVMAFSRSAAQAAGAISAPQSNESTETESKSETAESNEPAVSDSADDQPKAQTGSRGRPRAARANTANGVSVSLVFADGATVALPESSPLYARAVAVHTALFGGE